MNIVLSQQDADFILKFIRNDLSILCANHKKTEDSYKELQQLSEKYKEFSSSPLMQSIKETADVLMKETNESSKELIKDLEKCIELLTVGSQVC